MNPPFIVGFYRIAPDVSIPKAIDFARQIATFRTLPDDTGPNPSGLPLRQTSLRALILKETLAS
jgi:hypothetical protein